MLPVLYDQTGAAGVIDPRTGETHAIADASAEVLARVVEQIDDVADQARRARAALADELLARIGQRTRLDAGALEVERSTKREWDRDQTWAALAALKDAGAITEADMDYVMPYRRPAPPERKPDGRRLTSLLTRLAGDDPAQAQRLARARSETSSVRVKRIAFDATAEEVPS